MSQPQNVDRSYWPNRIQASMAVLAVVLSAAAFVISGLTYRQQEKLGDSQMALNEQAARRIAQRYASRVTVWGDAEGSAKNEPSAPHLFVLRLSNRSPVPIVNIALEVVIPGTKAMDSPKRRIYWAGDLPPCSVQSVRLYSYEPTDDRKGYKRDVEAPSLSTAGVLWILHFSDAVGSWMWRNGRLETEQTIWRRGGVDLTGVVFQGFLGAFEARVPTADCGEGG